MSMNMRRKRKESSIAIGDTKVMGWTWAADENPRYCVFYGMNEAGEQDFYRYDLRDKTIQRYFADQQTLEVTQDQYVDAVNRYNSLVDTYGKMKLILIGLGAVAAVLLVLVIILLVTRRGGGSGYGSGYQDREPDSRPSRGRRLTKEEQYMMGQEDDYEEEFPEEQELPVEEYQPEVLDDHRIYEQMSRGYTVETTHERDAVRAARNEAAATAGPLPDRAEEEEDFEIFDLDE